MVCELLGQLFRSPGLEATTFQFKLADALDVLFRVPHQFCDRSFLFSTALARIAVEDDIRAPLFGFWRVPRNALIIKIKPQNVYKIHYSLV